jgi:hypothetical protein
VGRVRGGQPEGQRQYFESGLIELVDFHSQPQRYTPATVEFSLSLRLRPGVTNLLRLFMILSTDRQPSLLESV